MLMKRTLLSSAPTPSLDDQSGISQQVSWKSLCSQKHNIRMEGTGKFMDSQVGFFCNRESEIRKVGRVPILYWLYISQ